MKGVVFGFLLAGFLLVAAGHKESHGQEKNNADQPIPEEFRTALHKAKGLDLYSLDPNTPVGKGDAGFHGWKVLGKTELKKEMQVQLVAAFKKGAAEADQKVGAGCFRPRHGIRVQLDGKAYDFVICFECVTVMIYGGKAEKNAGFNVSRSPTGLFNKTLTAANIKLPKQPKDE